MNRKGEGKMGFSFSSKHQVKVSCTFGCSSFYCIFLFVRPVCCLCVFLFFFRGGGGLLAAELFLYGKV